MRRQPRRHPARAERLKIASAAGTGDFCQQQTMIAMRTAGHDTTVKIQALLFQRAYRT